MTRVIAIQETQIKTLKENYDKTKPLNNATVLNESLNVPSIASPIPTLETIDQTPINMEEQIVNLNTSNIGNGIVNESATIDVFGSAPNAIVREENVLPIESPIMNNNDNSVTPFIDPTMSEQTQNNTQNAVDYVELLNSLRNMITEFANSAYSAIDEIQEKHLQKNEELPSTSADLVSTNKTNDIGIPVAPILNPGIPMMNPGINTQTNTPIEDLDNTIVIPGSAISDAISQGNSMTM